MDVGELFMNIQTMFFFFERIHCLSDAYIQRNKLPEGYKTLVEKIPLLPDLITKLSKDAVNFNDFCRIVSL